VLRAYSSLAMPADAICQTVESMIASEDAVECSVDIAVALLDNYASCGRLDQAEQFFERLCRLRASVSVLLWNIMIKVTY
jgi:pentatricopeptide repeat protein